jgi:hypothetical protein
METSRLRRYTLGVITTLALLAGCGGSQPPIGAPGAMPQSQSAATAVHAEGGGSWMLPEAKTDDLLYVTNYSYVSVYSYPQGKLVGALTGFNSTVGDCGDNKGNIFITNHMYRHGSVRIAEYAHGGTKLIAYLSQTHVGPVGCSVDSTTGDLAVSGFGGLRGVDIFKGARGKPSFYKNTNFVFTQFCGFDDKGNLFVDGPKDFSGDPAFAELPKGSPRLVDIKLDAIIDSSGGVQWDGKHVAVGAYIPHKRGKSTPVIYQFAIAGTQGQKVGTTILGSPAYVTSFQFFISRGIVIAPNWYYMNGSQKHDVLFYKYPAGGSPTMTLTKDVTDPRGVTLSRSPH